jgi:hypothetical protein
MNRTLRGRELGCPPVSVGGRNKYAVVVLTYTVFLGFDFNSRKNGGPQTRDRCLRITDVLSQPSLN